MVGLILLYTQPTMGSGPAGHDAHLAGLERIKRLEATVQALVAGRSVVESDGQGRRLQMHMDHGGMSMPMGAPAISPTPAPAPMHASLFFFAPDDSGAPVVTVLWGFWTVASWAGYAATLLVLLLWAAAHEWFASIRTAVAATRRSGKQKPDAARKSDLSQSLTSTNPSAADEENSHAARLIFHVTGMTCDGCATRIEKALKGTAGVLSAEVSYANSTAAVRYEAASVGSDPSATLAERIVELGYDAEAQPSVVEKGVTMNTSTGFTMTEQRLIAFLAHLNGETGAIVFGLTFLQLLSTYMLMLATMTFEVGVITAVVLGRSLSQHYIRCRRLQGAAALGVGDQLECCTS